MLPTTPKYSTLLSCLYDEPHPIGQLGRGTHYSVMRCAEWLNVDRRPLALAEVHDFAVIWDEDHDTRVMDCVEQLFMAGLLSPIQFIGERKGMLTVILAARYFWNMTDEYQAHVKAVAANVNGDYWSVDFGSLDRSLGSPQNIELAGIIADRDERVLIYLRNIDNLWGLGTKPYQAAQVVAPWSAAAGLPSGPASPPPFMPPPSFAKP